MKRKINLWWLLDSSNKSWYWIATEVKEGFVFLELETLICRAHTSLEVPEKGNNHVKLKLEKKRYKDMREVNKF